MGTILALLWKLRLTTKKLNRGKKSSGATIETKGHTHLFFFFFFSTSTSTKKINRARRGGRPPPGLPPVAAPFPAGGLPRRRVRARGRGAPPVPSPRRRRRKRSRGRCRGNNENDGSSSPARSAVAEEEESLGAPRRGAGRAPRLPGGPPGPRRVRRGLPESRRGAAERLVPRGADGEAPSGRGRDFAVARPRAAAARIRSETAAKVGFHRSSRRRRTKPGPVPDDHARHLPVLRRDAVRRLLPAARGAVPGRARPGQGAR